jgi:STIP1 family protein 1
MNNKGRAEQLKDEGNAAYGRGDIDDAVRKYTQAIQHYKRAVYFTNRANCYLRLGRVDQAEQDCETAIDLDPQWSKAYYFLGKIALEQRNSTSSAVRYYTKAFEKARSNADASITYLEDLHSALYSARKREWEHQQALRLAQQHQMVSYFTSLAELDASVSGEEKEKYVAQLCELVQCSNDPTQAMNPEPLQCGIGFDFMIDPVCTPSGRSYERKTLCAHLTKNPWDPVTREPLREADLVPNTALKEITHSYLQHYPWMYDA